MLGSVGQSEVVSLKALLDGEEFFVAEQVNIPVLYDQLWKLSGGQNVDDLYMHEYLDLRAASEQEIGTLSVWGTVEQLMAGFRSVKSWNATQSLNYRASM